MDRKNILKLTLRESMKRYFIRPPEVQEYDMTEGDEEVIRETGDEVMMAVCQK